MPSQTETAGAIPFSHPTPALKALMRGGVAGCHWLAMGAPVLAELAAEAAPDAIVIDLQHGSWDRAGLEAAVGAVGGRAPVLARVADQSLWAIGSALDAGCHGVIVPLVDTAEQCAAAVAAAHYPPKGRRSAGGARSTIDPAAYRAAAAEHLLVAVMIETEAGLAAAEAIAATPGLDMIFIGPTDLSLALGEGPGGARFEAALERVRGAAKAAGIAVGIYTSNLEIAEARAAEGFQFVVVAGDIHLNRSGAHAAWTRFRSKAG